MQLNSVGLEGGILSTGKITSGLYIVTCGDEKSGTGYLASWIQQVSFDPMLVCVCVGADRPARKIIESSGFFVVNILGNENKDLMKHFYKGFPEGQSAFTGISIEKGVSQTPYLTAAAASIECKVVSSAKPGDHMIFFGEVVGGVLRSSEKPMAHVRRSGKDY